MCPLWSWIRLCIGRPYIHQKMLAKRKGQLGRKNIQYDSKPSTFLTCVYRESLLSVKLYSLAFYILCHVSIFIRTVEVTGIGVLFTSWYTSSYFSAYERYEFRNYLSLHSSCFHVYVHVGGCPFFELTHLILHYYIEFFISSSTKEVDSQSYSIYWIKYFSVFGGFHFTAKKYI